jgi:hypothetical protein
MDGFLTQRGDSSALAFSAVSRPDRVAAISRNGFQSFIHGIDETISG